MRLNDRLPTLVRRTRPLALLAGAALSLGAYSVFMTVLAANNVCPSMTGTSNPPIIATTCTLQPCQPSGECNHQNGTDPTFGAFSYCNCPNAVPGLCCYLRLYTTFPPGQDHPWGVGGDCISCSLPHTCKVTGSGTAASPWQASCTNEPGYHE